MVNARALLFAPLALAFGVGACELIAGIEDVIDARDGGATSGSGGNGGGSTSSASSSSSSSGCRPAALEICDGGPCAPETFMPGLSQPIGIATHRDMVYWSESGRVAGKRVDAEPDGGPSQIWPLTNPIYSGQPEELAADDTGVYWAYYNGPCLGHGPHDAGKLSLLGDCGGTFGGKIALRGDHVFAVVSPQETASCDGGPDCCGPVGKGCIFKVPKAGGPVFYYAQSEDTSDALAVDDQHVYWSTFAQGHGTIKRCPLAGCPQGGSPEVIAVDAGNVVDITLDGGHVYWLERQGGNVFRKPLGQAPDAGAELLAASHYYGSALTVDDHFVYFTDGDRVFRTPKEQGAHSTVDPITSMEWPWVSDLVTTCEHVYWINRATQGSVLRAPR